MSDGNSAADVRRNRYISVLGRAPRHDEPDDPAAMVPEASLIAAMREAMRMGRVDGAEVSAFEARLKIDPATSHLAVEPYLSASGFSCDGSGVWRRVAGGRDVVVAGSAPVPRVDASLVATEDNGMAPGCWVGVDPAGGGPVPALHKWRGYDAEARWEQANRPPSGQFGMGAPASPDEAATQWREFMDRCRGNVDLRAAPLSTGAPVPPATPPAPLRADPPEIVTFRLSSGPITVTLPQTDEAALRAENAELRAALEQGTAGLDATLKRWDKVCAAVMRENQNLRAVIGALKDEEQATVARLVTAGDVLRSRNLALTDEVARLRAEQPEPAAVPEPAPNFAAVWRGPWR